MLEKLAALLCGLSAVFMSLFLPFSAAADETYVLGTVNAEPTVTFNNWNWLTTPHPLVAQFTAESNGNFYGTTTTGVPFEQYTIPNNLGIRIQRFQIEDHYHFIVNGKIANSLDALSRQLALAYLSM